MWFFENKTIAIETNVSNLALFPKEDLYSDRMKNQLIYIPSNYDEILKTNIYKTIFMPDGLEEYYKTEYGNIHKFEA